MAATLSLAACSSEENENIQPQQMEARVNLTIKGAPVQTRSTDTALPTDEKETNIERVTVAIFNSGGSVNVIQEFAKTAEVADITTSIQVKCTAAENCTGIVVANAPEKHFAGITTKDDFKKKLIDLSQDAKQLPMSGDIKAGSGEAATTTFTLTAGDNTAVTLSAKVSRLVARVAVTSIKTAFDEAGQYADATFKLKKIFLHKAQSKYPADPETPTEQTVTEAFRTGWWNETVTSIHEDKLVDAVNGETGTAMTGTAYTTPYWFYTFPNGNAQSTRLVIYGEFDPDGTGEGSTESPIDVYYPVVVNKLQTGTTINDGSSNIGAAVAGKGDGTIARNTTYAIKATIKGKGVDSPDKDMNPATVNLTVTIAGWALNITQNVEFN